MQTKLLDKNGKESGTVELNEKIFNRKINKTLLWEAVNAIRDNDRQGNASTKNRSEVRGGGKKPWRQKGIGWARHGSTRSPIWKGGGVSHGPKPRDYSGSIPKKKKLGALLVSLSVKAQENRILIIDDIALDAPKTKDFAQVLKEMKIANARTLLAVDEVNRNLLLASRNVPYVELKKASDINCYDVLRAEYLLITKKGLNKLEERCAASK